MAAPLSEDLRKRIVAAVTGGSSIRPAAARFAVSPSAAIKLLQRVRRTGSLTPGQIGGHRRPALEAHEATLRALVAAKPDLTLGEIKAELAERHGIAVGLTTIHTTLHRLRLRFKKKLESL
jgi:transposase